MDHLQPRKLEMTRILYTQVIFCLIKLILGHIVMEKGIANLQNVIENRINSKNYLTDEEVIKFIKDMLEALIHL